jgi:hypothetical protein
VVQQHGSVVFELLGLMHLEMIEDAIAPSWLLVAAERDRSLPKLHMRCAIAHVYAVNEFPSAEESASLP